MSKQHQHHKPAELELPPESPQPLIPTGMSSDQEVGNAREATLEEALAGVKISVLAQVIEDRLRKMLAEGIPVEESLTCAHGLRTRMEVYDASPEPGSPST